MSGSVGSSAASSQPPQSRGPELLAVGASAATAGAGREQRSRWSSRNASPMLCGGSSVTPLASRLIAGCDVSSRAASCFCEQPAACSSLSNSGQSIRFRIGRVYTKTDLPGNGEPENPKMPLRDVVLSNILALMEQREIASMTELARLSDVPQSVLSRFKTGRHGSISLEALEKVAQALEVPPSKLLDSSTSADPRTMTVLAAMESLPDWGKDAVAASAQALVHSSHQRKQ